MNPPVGHAHHKEQVERGQAALRPHLDRRDVDCSQAVPMSLQKRPPRGLTLSFGRWLDPVLLQDVGHRARRVAMAQVRQRALDAIVPPGRIVASHAQHDGNQLLRYRRPPDFLAPVREVPLPCTNNRCQRRIVSGVTRVPISSNTLRPSTLPLTANRRRSSLSGMRRLPSFSRSTRFSVRRYSLTCCYWRFTQPARIMCRSCQGCRKKLMVPSDADQLKSAASDGRSSLSSGRTGRWARAATYLGSGTCSPAQFLDHTRGRTTRRRSPSAPTATNSSRCCEPGRATEAPVKSAREPSAECEQDTGKAEPRRELRLTSRCWDLRTPLRP